LAYEAARGGIIARVGGVTDNGVGVT